MNFQAWLAAVDAIFVEKVGMGRDDWPDQCYYDWWSDDLSPEEAVAEAVLNEYGLTAVEDLGLGDYV